MTGDGRFVRWLGDVLRPGRAAKRRARQQRRARAWQHKMWERTQGRPVRLAAITRDGIEQPPETVELLRSVDAELDQEGYHR